MEDTNEEIEFHQLFAETYQLVESYMSWQLLINFHLNLSLTLLYYLSFTAWYFSGYENCCELRLMGRGKIASRKRDEENE